MKHRPWACRNVSPIVVAVLALATVLVTCWCMPPVSSASELALAPALPEISGTVHWQLHYEPEQHTVAANGFGLKINLDGSFSDSLGYHLALSGRLEFASPPSPKADAALGEAYFDAWLGPLDLRAGRQVLSWGTADWINPTNVVNPSHMLSGAGQDVGAGMGAEAVPAIAGTLYAPGGSAVTGVVVLDFIPGKLPPGMEMFEPEGKPDTYPDRLEVAIRGETMIRGFNVYASYFNGWHDLPALWLEVTDPTMPPCPKATYRGMRQFGLAVAGAVGNSAIWFEGALTVPERLSELEQPHALAMSSNDMAVRAVLGGDYTFPSGLFVSEQLIYDSEGALISPYCRPGEASTLDPALYWLSILRYAPNDKCTLEFAGLVDFSERSAMLLPRCTVKTIGNMEVWCALISVVGDESSDLAALSQMASGFAAGTRVSF
ncbi:MAG: hypothetical protein PHQ21_06100 [Firmicutes bacterium]|nr:hypothetical protein [Bacillota bacterium]